MKIKCKSGLAAILVAISFVSGAHRVFAADSVRILDDGDPGFSTTNTAKWSRATGLGFNSDFLMGIGNGNFTTWSFPVNPGSYRVSITWPNFGSPYNMSFSTTAPVKVSAAGADLMSGTINLRTTPIDRTDGGVGWKDLGVFTVPSGPLQVRLEAVAKTYVIADAVRIERPDGTAITVPTITTTSPMNSPLSGGIPITIRGSQFVPGTRVLFGSQESSEVTIVSPTELTAISPLNSPGVVDITVVNPEGLSSVLRSKFTYAIGRTLDDGENGFTATTPISTVTRLGFQKDFVYPGGPNKTASASWTMLVNKTPMQRVAISWYDAGLPYNKVFSNDVRFDVIDGTTVLASVAGSLQKKPNDFNDLGFGWKDLGYFTFPSGQVKVVLRNNTDKTLIADAIRVEEIVAAPTLNSVVPNKGPMTGGTPVELVGSGFLPGATVTFGNVSGTNVQFNSRTSLTVTTPASLKRRTVVQVINPDSKRTSLSVFTFQPISALDNFNQLLQDAAAMVSKLIGR